MSVLPRRTPTMSSTSTEMEARNRVLERLDEEEAGGESIPRINSGFMDRECQPFFAPYKNMKSNNSSPEEENAGRAGGPRTPTEKVKLTVR